MARRLTYREKLKNPRWQRKRLEILKRADWRCEWCAEGDKNLQVHHGFYGKDVEPWEYESDTLWCLCDPCHEQAETIRRTIYCELARIHPRFHGGLRELLVEVQNTVSLPAQETARTNTRRRRA